mmetsp:Transcript_22870/g.35295  ORF Transcript_22870/g.35295 Transcript_22870/m.35295 type:complete len:209 (-) Transcript_22870:884-1510(-)
MLLIRLLLLLLLLWRILMGWCRCLSIRCRSLAVGWLCTIRLLLLLLTISRLLLVVLLCRWLLLVTTIPTTTTLGWISSLLLMILLWRISSTTTTISITTTTTAASMLSSSSCIGMIRSHFNNFTKHLFDHIHSLTISLDGDLTVLPCRNILIDLNICTGPFLQIVNGHTFLSNDSSHIHFGGGENFHLHSTVSSSSRGGSVRGRCCCR